jgi:hypothetical protein
LFVSSTSALHHTYQNHPPKNKTKKRVKEKKHIKFEKRIKTPLVGKKKKKKLVKKSAQTLSNLVNVIPFVKYG